MLKRFVNIESNIKPNKVLVIFGARRVGKTTLLNEFLSQTKLKYKLETGDNLFIQDVLSSQNLNTLKEYIEGYELLAIDEAQNIPNIAMNLKLLVDNIKDLAIIVTGSSSFNISQILSEPLTGRKKTIMLYPLSQKELLQNFNKFELREKLEEFLIFGSYPEIVMTNSRNEKIDLLNELVNSYLLKDIFTFERLKASSYLFNLLKLIAFQVGNLVSISELSTQLKIDVKTVDRYLDLLEKAFVIKRLGGFSRNLRNEIVKKAKFYFFDNGIRNAIISNYNALNNRNDVGALFENFIIMERLKFNHYENNYLSSYFWRIYDGQEIDLIEERDGKLFPYEIKWQKSRIKTPDKWKQNYDSEEIRLINNMNYLDFIS